MIFQNSGLCISRLLSSVDDIPNSGLYISKFCMYSLSGEEDLGWRGCHIVLKSLAAQLKPSLIAASVAFEFDLMEHN
jgi:hypothetical protein